MKAETMEKKLKEMQAARKKMNPRHVHKIAEAKQQEKELKAKIKAKKEQEENNHQTAVSKPKTQKPSLSAVKNCANKNIMRVSIIEPYRIVETYDSNSGFYKQVFYKNGKEINTNIQEYPMTGEEEIKHIDEYEALQHFMR